MGGIPAKKSRDRLDNGLLIDAPGILVRDIVALGGKDEISDLLFFDYNPFTKPDVPKLERALEEIHDRLKREAHERGWEPKD